MYYEGNKTRVLIEINTEIIRPKIETLSFHVVSCFVGKGSPLIHSKTKPAFRLKQLFNVFFSNKSGSPLY